jgi:hypothetical protein
VVRHSVYEGNRCRITFEANGIEAQLEAPPGRELVPGEQIRVGLHADLLVVLPAIHVEPDTEPAPVKHHPQRIELALSK